MHSKSRSFWQRRHALALIRPDGKVHEHGLYFGGFHGGTKERTKRRSLEAILGPVSGWLTEMVVRQEFKTSGAGISDGTNVAAHVFLICARIR